MLYEGGLFVEEDLDWEVIIYYTCWAEDTSAGLLWGYICD